MIGDNLNAAESVSAGLIASPKVADKMMVCGRFKVEHIRDGVVIWEDEFDNLVVDTGKNTMLDKLLDLGAAHSAIHMGLKGSGTPVAGDTMASHASWSALNINANRLVPAFSAAASGSKTTSSAVSFTITSAGPTTVAGVFIVLSGTNGNTNTTGTLFSAGDFSTSRSVIASDVLNVTYTCSL